MRFVVGLTMVAGSLVVVGCGSAGSTQAGAGVGLDGFVVGSGSSTGFVVTPKGVVVVDTDHDGHPAFALPSSDGNGAGDAGWVSDVSTPALTGMAAWSDGDTVHVVGHACPPGARGATSTTAGEPDAGCPDADLVATSFSVASGAWRGSSRTIPTKGAILDLGTGAGEQVAAVRSDGAPGTGLAVVDVDEASVTTLEPGVQPTGSVCPSSGRFVARRGTAADAREVAGGPGVTADRPAFAVLDGDRWIPVETTGDPLPDDAPLVTTEGCVDGGVLVEASWPDARRTAAYLVRSRSGDDGLVVEALPDAGLGGFPIDYRPDATGTRVVASVTQVAASEPDRTTSVAIWSPQDASWTPVDRSAPAGFAGVLVATERVYALTDLASGYRLQELG